MKHLSRDSWPFIAVIVALAFLLVSLPGGAQEAVTDDEVNEVARDLYCPVCENTPLDVCPTQPCQDWRALIREQLAEGKSKEEIQQYFVEQYGARVLAEPPRRGFNAIVWLLPIGAVLLGAIFFGRFLRNLRTTEVAGKDDTMDVAQSTAPEPPPAADEDDYLSRVEKEVREE